jgi:hypothetical protein
MVKGIGKGFIYLVLFGSFGIIAYYSGVLVRAGKAKGGSVLSTMFLIISGSEYVSLLSTKHFLAVAITTINFLT